MNQETRKCQNCHKDFTIEPDDFGFYEKINVPPPTFCPECRMIRRVLWRNERTIYHGTCDLCRKSTISIYNPDSSYKVYCYDCFFSDKWDQLKSGKEYDFNKTFFKQFEELLLHTPKLARQLSHDIRNSDYTNHVGEVKDCYLIFASTNDEDCYYANYVSYSKWIFDSLRIFKSEWCYECVDCQNCHNLKYSMQCSACFDSAFIFNCKSCSNCFLCTNLVSQSYCIRNIKYSKEEYFEKLKAYDLGRKKVILALAEEFELLKKKSIHRAVEGFNNIRSTGNYMRNTKNCRNCFDISDAEDCKYVSYSNDTKDTMDAYAAYPKTELCYETVGSGHPSYNCKFTYLPWESSDILYSVSIYSASHNCFGCTQISGKSYCILNKQYSKEEYEALLPKIIKHMNDMPYKDNAGRLYKYGEFFPPELSPFAYNETIAQQYYPADRKKAESFGSGWHENKDRNYKTSRHTEELQDNIKDVRDDILSEVIACEHAGKCNEQCTEAFKVTENELGFYRKMKIPLPTLCHNCRHYRRLAKRNPMKLWHRSCMCEKAGHNHTGRCPNEFETSYAPERPEIVYCESCYQKEVY